MIGAHASRPHYWRHLAPIVAELRARGHDVVESTRDATARATLADVEISLVASSADARLLRGRDLVYVEHGAGQTYSTAPGHPGWPGGRGLDHVRLFICPGEHVATAWRAEYRATPIAVVGCPALDRRVTSAIKFLRRKSHRRVVAFSFHWRCGIAPEAYPALEHYRAALPATIAELRSRSIDVIGHGHPRYWRRLEPTWRAMGVEAVGDYEEVLDRAGVLVADNTSALYEFAALDRPVVCLNAPEYRRDVEHGLRFWSHVPGLQVDEPGDLVDGISTAIADPGWARDLRSRAARYVYAQNDGRAAVRAAEAIEELTR